MRRADFIASPPRPSTSPPSRLSPLQLSATPPADGAVCQQEQGALDNPQSRASRHPPRPSSLASPSLVSSARHDTSRAQQALLHVSLRYMPACARTTALPSSPEPTPVRPPTARVQLGAGADHVPVTDCPKSCAQHVEAAAAAVRVRPPHSRPRGRGLLRRDPGAPQPVSAQGQVRPGQPDGPPLLPRPPRAHRAHDRRRRGGV